MKLHSNVYFQLQTVSRIRQGKQRKSGDLVLETLFPLIHFHSPLFSQFWRVFFQYYFKTEKNNTKNIYVYNIVYYILYSIKMCLFTIRTPRSTADCTVHVQGSPQWACFCQTYEATRRDSARQISASDTRLQSLTRQCVFASVYSFIIIQVNFTATNMSCHVLLS